MGMLIHHTWLNQQKKAEKKPVAEPVAKSTEIKEPEATEKKTGGRRKTSK